MNKLLIFLLSLCVTSLEAATITNWGAQLPTAVPAGSDVILMQKGGITYYFTPNQLATSLSTNTLFEGTFSPASSMASNAVANLNGKGTNNTFYDVTNLTSTTLPSLTASRVVVLDGSKLLTNGVTTTALLDNFFAMGITSIVASTGIGIGTNGGALVITNTASSAASNAVANLNGLGTNVTFYTALNLASSALPTTSNSVDMGSHLLPVRTNFANNVVAKANGVFLGSVNIGTNTVPLSPFEITSLGIKHFHQDLTNESLYIGERAGQSWPYLSATGTVGNVGIGFRALQQATNGDNTAVGVNSMAGLINGLYHTAIGVDTMILMNNCDGNTAVGKSVLTFTTSGGNNTGIGAFSLYGNTTGSNNLAGGLNALKTGTVGRDNVALGANSLSLAIPGNQNTSVGGAGNLRSTTGADNTSLGASGGYGLTTGSRNLFLHSNAGTSTTTGSDNIIIGYLTDLPAASSNNMLSINNLIYATGMSSGPGAAVSTGNVGIKTYTPHSTFHVAGTVAVGTNNWPASVPPSATVPMLISTIANGGGLVINNGNPTIAANRDAGLYMGARATTGADTMAYARIYGAKENANSGDFASYLQFKTLSAGGSEIPAIRIDSTGKVGIGTTSPLGNLHVVGGIVQTNGGIWQAWSLGAPSAPDANTQGAVYWNDGTNICAVFRNAAGALSTNKLSMTAWP